MTATTAPTGASPLGMAPPEPPAPPSMQWGRRVNPFVFPSDTDARFALLVISLLGTSLYIFNVLYFALAGGGMGELSVYARCDQAATAAALTRGARRGGVDLSTLLALKAAAVDQCTAPFGGAVASWMVAGVALLLVLTWLLYWLTPAWTTRRRQLVPLSEDDAPEVVRHLAELCRQAALSRPPLFVWNPLDPTCGALAFGRLGRYYVALAGGLVTRFYTDPPAFRAVLLHELAHLRNGDVDKTYFAVATWRAFVVAALVPYLLSLIGQPLDWAASVTWRVFALAVLVYLTRSAVLRARELYADARAANSAGVADDLARVFEALPAPAPATWRETNPAVRALGLHPDPAERRRALYGPQRLLHMGFWEPFGAGIAATIAIPHVATLVSLATSGPSAGLLVSQVVAALVFVPLGVGVVGLGAWRMAFATLASISTAAVPPAAPSIGGTGKRPGSLHLGAGLGAGLVAGRFLSFDAVVAGSSADLAGRLSLAASDLFTSCVAGLLLAGALLLVCWITASAGVWLAAARAAPRPPRAACLVGLAIAGCALVVWLAALRAAAEVAALLWPQPVLVSTIFGLLEALAGAVVVLLQEPLTLALGSLATLGLLAFPMAGRLWPHGHPQGAHTPADHVADGELAGWAFLDR